jgi:hypothetical protein
MLFWFRAAKRKAQPRSIGQLKVKGRSAQSIQVEKEKKTKKSLGHRLSRHLAIPQFGSSVIRVVWNVVVAARVERDRGGPRGMYQ